MRFRDFPQAYGHVRLKTWDEWANEYIKRSWYVGGDLHEAIQRAERDGFRPRVRYDDHNLVENVGRDLLVNFLGGVGGLSGIEYVALGQSNTEPDGTETQLADEQIRITLSSSNIANHQLTVTGYFDTGQANVLLGSAALFGNGATDVANSGTIYSYVVYQQFTKNNLESLTAQWSLGFTP